MTTSATVTLKCDDFVQGCACIVYVRLYLLSQAQETTRSSH